MFIGNSLHIINRKERKDRKEKLRHD